MPGPTYQFGDFRLDIGAFRLFRKGHPLRVERKPMELLILLASRPGELVMRAEIAERLWSSEVFVDTDHGINTAIRKLRHLLRDNPENPQFIETATGMGYRFIASVTTLETPSPEILPTAGSASRNDSPAEPEASIRGAASKPRRLWILLSASAAFSLVILALFGPHPFAARLLHRSAQSDITSIAVLPLDNLSGDPNQEYFADGITDELITMLAKDTTLRITSRTSVMQYKNVHRPLPEIARALNVDAILEGSVSRTDNRMHLTLQLIRADTDTHLWAESYDQDNADAVALPDQAAREIAHETRSSTNPPAKTRYVNPAAHDAYLRGNFYWYRGRNQEALQAFRKATQLQPDYALGWTGISEVYGQMADQQMNPAEAMSLEEQHARKAVALDDQLAEAHLVMGAAYFYGHWDFAHGLQEISRAIELDPRNAQAWHFRARLLSVLGRFDESIADQKQATLLDPFSRPWGMIEAYNWARRFDDAIADGRSRLSYAPEVNWVLTDSYRGKHMWKESAEALEENFARRGDLQSATGVHRAFEQGGYKAVVRWQLNELLKQRMKGYVSPALIALRYAELGDREKTLANLEAAFRVHSVSLLEVQTDPAFDFLHSDPRYRSLIQHIGLPPAY